MKLAILLGIACVIVPLVLYSLRVSYSIRTDEEFFLGTRRLSAIQLFDTLAAGWLMLGNVFLACLVLGKYYGAHNWWLVFTWLCAFFFIVSHVGPIAQALTTHRTLHSFLSTSFDSPMIRVLAAIVTATTGIGIIALEIIVVMAILVPVTGEAAPWFPFVAGFMILLTLALYSVLGGFNAVTRTDAFQLFGVILALVSLLIVVTRAVLGNITNLDNIRQSLAPTFASTGTSPFWFFAGIFFLQVPLLLGDFGTWQRIKASSLDTILRHRKMFGILGIVNAFAWIILVASGIALAAIPADRLTEYPNSFLYTIAAPIVDLINLSTLPPQFGQPFLGLCLVFFLVIGLVCAMMSTADTYLLITLQTFHDDLLLRAPSRTAKPGSGITFSRAFAIIGVALSFIIAVFVVLRKANFIPIVSLLFSLQVSLAPFALVALYYPDVRRLRYTGTLALCVTIGLCVAYGLWAVFSSAAAGGFHQVNVTFILPVIAFMIPTVALGMHLVCLDGPAVTGRWLLAALAGRKAGTN